MRMSASFELDLGRVDHGPHLDRGEARLPASVAVEGADAHQAVRAPLGRHQPVGVAAPDGELGRRGCRPPCPRRRRRPSTAKPRRSAQRLYIRSSISAQSCASTPPSLALMRQMASASSCSPVNRLRSSSSDSSRRERQRTGLDLRLVALVALLSRQLVQDLDVLHLLRQRVVGVDVVLHPGVLAGQLLGPVLVVPEVGGGDRHLELGQPRPRGVDPQVPVGLSHTVAERAQVVGEVAHRSTTVAHLVLLARPARARLVATGLGPLVLDHGLLLRARRRGRRAVRSGRCGRRHLLR